MCLCGNGIKVMYGPTNVSSYTIPGNNFDYSVRAAYLWPDRSFRPRRRPVVPDGGSSIGTRVSIPVQSTQTERTGEDPSTWHSTGGWKADERLRKNVVGRQDRAHVRPTCSVWVDSMSNVKASVTSFQKRRIGQMLMRSTTEKSAYPCSEPTLN